MIKGWDPWLRQVPKFLSYLTLPSRSLHCKTHTPLPLILFCLLVMYSVGLGLAVLYFLVPAVAALPVQHFSKRDNTGDVSCRLILNVHP